MVLKPSVQQEILTYESADQWDHTFEIFRSVFDSFNPIGGGDIYQAVTPTPLDPLMAIGTNKDFSGRQIAREDFSGLRPTPGYTRAKEGASIMGKGLAQFINFASGGNEDEPGVFSPSPDTIDYLFGQGFGGVGRETLKLTSSIESLFTGEELPSYKIPLAGRFYGKASGKAGTTAMYYANLKRVYLANERLEGLRERGENTTEHLKDKPEATLEKYAFKQHRAVGKLRKQRRKLIEEDASRERVKQIEDRIEMIMKNVNTVIKNKREK